MKRVFFFFLATVLAFSSLYAQRARFELQIEPAPEGDIKVFVLPLTAEGAERAIQLRERDGKFIGNVTASEKGLYNIVAVCDNRQLMSTAHVVLNEEGKALLTVKIQGYALMLDNSPENKALSALNVSMTDVDRTLWTKQGLDSDSLRVLVEKYSQLAASVTNGVGLSETVEGYIDVWAFTRAYNAYASIPRAQNIDASAVGFEASDVLPSLEQVLDNDYTPLFPVACQMIAKSAPADVLLLERLKWLHDTYSNDAVRTKVGSLLLAEFLSEHDYSADFEGGMQQLKRAVTEYSLPERFVEEYIRRKATIVGSPFPAEVVLEDANGDVVDFSSFKGKYVYIDLWASWCGPCRKEVPHLQALEAELKNENVVFLSISTDTDTDAWKKSMAELNMHGHQLHDRDNKLCNALNIKGIPFFLIYDKEGNLHTYRAMRPSKGELLKNFLEALE